MFVANVLNEASADKFVTEMEIGKRRYPVRFKLLLSSVPSGEAVQIRVLLEVAEWVFPHEAYVSSNIFVDDFGVPRAVPFEKILARGGLSIRETTGEEYQPVLRQASAARDETGKPCSFSAPFFLPAERGSIYTVAPRDDSPTVVIIDPELEAEIPRLRTDRDDRCSPLPWVRVFSMEYKAFGFVDVRDLHEMAWDETAIDRLVIDARRREILAAVLSTTETMAADVLAGRHGGFVILARGPSGTGKTLTAEVFSHYVRRPLYVIDVAELRLGHSAEGALETRLETIFARATRWNTILLFDEADIILKERGFDLLRSTVVATFLRKLDYFRGTLFLTTNRYFEIDAAIQSRVTLTLDYVPLDAAARAQVWDNFLAGFTLPAGVRDLLVAQELNGRQIRNTVRLMRMLGTDRLEQMGAANIVLLARESTGETGVSLPGFSAS